MHTIAAVDSQAIAKTYLDWVAASVDEFPFKPKLATVLYTPTADEASVKYRDLILKDAESLGLAAEKFEAKSVAELQQIIRGANEDPGIHGITALYPMRAAVSDDEVMDWVSPYKDAEGLHSLNLGYLVKYKRFLDDKRAIKCVVPATPKAVVKVLQHYRHVPVSGAFAVVVNNSMRVGKPLALMLENLGATVVKCYHLTGRADLEACVRQARIVITAVPDPAFRLEPAWIRDGAALIDVSHQGNFDARALSSKASLITMPDNRIGRVTRAMMFVNLIYCARYKGVFY